MARDRRAAQLCDVIVDEPCVQAIRSKVRMAQQALQEAEAGGYPFDLKLAECSIGSLHRVGKVGRWRMGDQLCEQGIEVRIGRVSDVGEGIDAKAGTRRRLECGERSPGGLGGPVGSHRFHVDARLNRESTRLGDVFLLQAKLGERFSGRKLKLRLHKVDAGDLLGYRVFYLQARIGFDEGEGPTAGDGRVDQKLEGTEIVVVSSLGELQRRGDDFIAQHGSQARAWRNFDDLLVLTLHAAFALPEVADVTAVVTQNLNLDMARTRHQLLDVDISNAKRRAGLGLTAFEGLFDIFGTMNGADAAAPATGNRLDHDGRVRAE